MGPSGSGKSTLMNLLGCLDTPTSGSYELNGSNVSNMTDDELAEIRNKEIGFVFQTLTSTPHYRVGKCSVANDLCRCLKKRTNRTRKTSMTDVGLADRMDHKPNNFQGDSAACCRGRAL